MTLCGINGTHSIDTSSTGGRALSITGGAVDLAQVVLTGHNHGAIFVAKAVLVLIDCRVENSHAQTGGALLVGSGANVTIVSSNLTENSATTSGGALQVPCGADPLQVVPCGSALRICAFAVVVHHYRASADR